MSGAEWRVLGFGIQVMMVEQHIEEDLFAMLDNETNERIVRDVCLTLERLLEAACPSCPSRWLRLCRNVVRSGGCHPFPAQGAGGG